MEELSRLIILNPNIPYELKGKIIECLNKILNKYPIAYRNLYINLQDINIIYTNDIYKNKLKEKMADSIYDAENNTLVFDKNSINGVFYQNLLIHELLHVSSYDKDKETLGFISISSEYGESLNEGMVEYLTGEILDNHRYGMAIYANDINNVLFFNRLIGENNMINSFFYSGLNQVLISYINVIGSNKNLETILINMDLDHQEQLKNNFNNKYKDEYIKCLIEDFSKIELDKENDVDRNIRYAYSFICGQYKSKTVPNNIKLSIEKSFNAILNNCLVRKNKQL